tara:strand:+ start:362 stop:535 length:174 start_codon:yes stop_codon:yes gene_type:complete
MAVNLNEVKEIVHVLQKARKSIEDKIADGKDRLDKIEKDIRKYQFKIQKGIGRREVQ